MTDYDPLKADFPQLVQPLAAEGIVGEQQHQKVIQFLNQAKV